MVFRRASINHVLPLLVLILYSIFGGWLFSTVESPAYFTNFDLLTINNDSFGDKNLTINDQPVNSKTDWESVYNKLVANLTRQLSLYKSINNDTIYDFRHNLTRRLRLLTEHGEFRDNESVSKIIKFRFASAVWNEYERRRRSLERLVEQLLVSQSRIIQDYTTLEVTENPWNIWNSIFYSTTLYTTIGYGNIAPKTFKGRLFSIFYALVGIPLLLAILRDYGALLFRIVKFCNNKVNRWKEKRSKWIQVSGPTEITDLPLSTALAMLIIWLCFSAGVFLIWEDEWNYFTSFYFLFISFSTIGLGDVVPKYPQYALLAFLFVLVGLSVVSMSLNVIQAKVEGVFNSLIQNIDAEYKQKQMDPSASDMSIGKDYTGGMGVMQLWKKRPIRERILFSLMDKHKKQMLEDYWVKKAENQNASTQTTEQRFSSVNLQCDLDDEEILPNGRPRPKKYIYNLHD